MGASGTVFPFFVGHTDPCMRPFLLISLVAILIGSGSCSLNERYARHAHRYGSATDSVFFSMERTPCFGKCPSFTLSIDAGGRASWRGRGNVERMGNWTAQVPATAMDALLTMANAHVFFGFNDSYDGQVTDLPSTIIRVNADGRDKRVHARYKVPPAFKAFAAECDSLLNALPWTQAAGQEQ